MISREHFHCPFDCEHPQPFTKDGILVCGRCWFRFGQTSPMILCTPETCVEARQ